MQFSWTGWRWYEASVMVWQESWVLDAGEAELGWIWDATWMEFWHKCLAVDLGEMQPGWRWYMNIGTGMELRIELDGSEMQISAPKWRWDGTWMEVTQIFHDLDSYETGPGWRWDASFGTRMGNTSPGRRSWEANMQTGMEVRLDLYGEETGILELRWSLDANLETWMGVEMRPGFS